MPLNGGSSKISKRLAEKFRNRKVSLVRKCDELRFHCQADVYILVSRNGRYYVYTSTDPSLLASVSGTSCKRSFQYILTLDTNSALG